MPEALGGHSQRQRREQQSLLLALPDALHPRAPVILGNHCYTNALITKESLGRSETELLLGRVVPGDLL